MVESMKAGPLTAGRWRWIVLAWAVPAVISVAQQAVASLVRSSHGVRLLMPPMSVLSAALEIAEWLSWALLTPAIFKLATRIPVRGPRLARNLCLHFAAALVTGFTVESVWYAVRIPALAHSAPTSFTGPVAAAMFWPVVLGGLVASAFIYAAVVGVATALEHHQRMHDQELRAATLEAQLATAHAHSLKMQLHPHFLFNALHAAVVMIRRQPESAAGMLTRLGDLLRLTLARADRTEVPLKRELELLHLYFEIEQMRFRDRLTVGYEIAADTEAALVPDLILQPLAENAVRHGVARTRGPASIHIRSRRDGDWLEIDVEDNGRGLVEFNAAHEGVGLGSTRRRLAALYGERQQLVLVPASAHYARGCIARIRIPCRFQAPADVRSTPAPVSAGRAG